VRYTGQKGKGLATRASIARQHELQQTEVASIFAFGGRGAPTDFLTGHFGSKRLWSACDWPKLGRMNSTGQKKRAARGHDFHTKKRARF
jgi:hypothetical protein